MSGIHIALENASTRLARAILGPAHIITVRIEWDLRGDDWTGVTLYNVRARSRPMAAAKGLRKVAEEMHGFRRVILEAVTNAGE